MESFTILANLFVLGIVGVVLTLFRKNDKNSKSLEQVKKYATKRNEEFDLYVENKITELKDLSVALDVQEKTGAVILNKISDEVDSLSEKITHIEELNKKVTGYNSTMDKMLNLSRELDDRYIKLKKDADYIEVLDKKVKEGSKKLSLVEKGIKDITSEFIKNNNISMDKLKEELISSTTESLDKLDKKATVSSQFLKELDDDLNQLKDNFNKSSDEKLDSFRQNLDNLLENHKNNIDKITSDSEKMEQDTFSDLQKRIDNRSEELINLLNEKVDIVEKNNIEKIKKLSMDMGNIENVANSIKDENRKRLESIKEQLDNQLLIIKEVNSSGVKSLQEEFNNNFNEFKGLSLSQIEKAKEDSQNLFDQIKEKYRESEEYKDEVVNKLTNAEDYIMQEVRDLQDRMDSSVEEITRNIETREDGVKEEVFKLLEQNIDKYKDDIENRLEDIESIKNDFTQSLDSTKEQLQNQKDSVQNRLSELELYYNDLNKKIESSDEDIKNKLDSQRDRIMNNVLNDIDNRLEALNSQFTEKISSLYSFEDNIDSARDELQQILKSKYQNTEEEYNLFKNTISERMEQDRAEIQDFIDKISNEKLELEQGINQLKESAYNNISEKLTTFEDEYFNKLKEKQDYIDVETERWKENIDLSVKEIHEKSLDTIVKSMNEVNSQVDNFEQTVQNRIDELNSTLEDHEEKLLENNKLFKESVGQDIDNIKEQLIQLSSDFDNKSANISEVIGKIELEQERYINESDIFTKADSLKEDLERSIDMLLSKITDIEGKSEFITGVESRLNDLKTLTGNLNDQISSVDDKRSRIESLENRISKALELSDSVDDKLNRIKESEEEVSEVQLKLRTLKELEQEVSLEYSRLEKKQDLLTETNKSIDNGFSHIQIIENKLDVLKDNLTPFNNQIDNIKEKLATVEERETKIDKAISTLATLDTSLENLEDKIEKMDKAREWIAGVETRLNESVRTANEQVKLMGALAQNKNDKKNVSDTPSAPNMNMREMVIKLAHNGWKPEDIARTTKLSRGEVELILELSPRK